MSLKSPHQVERHRPDGVVRSALGAMSFYIAPLAIALFSIVALVFWNGYYQTAPERPLRLQVIQTGAPLSPGDALARLSAAPRVYQHETRLSEDPVWFSFQLPADASMQTAVELPSRHAVEMACWDAV